MLEKFYTALQVAEGDENGTGCLEVQLSHTEGDENGTGCLGVQLSYTVTGGHKYRGLVLQVGDSTKG
jgi:hypothetical protein